MTDSLIQIPPPWRLISDARQLAEALELIKSESVLGVDTETYWDAASKRMFVSLLQISSRHGDVLVCDFLAIGAEPLRGLVESPDIIMVAHNARFDDTVLHGAGLQPQGFVDTLQLSRLSLSLPSYSLAAVTEHLFGLPLDKTLRMSNWRRRPLAPAQLAYAAADARITLNVFNELRRRLEARGVWDEALRSAHIKAGASRGSRPRRNTQALDLQLSPAEERLVQRLKKWRLSHANTLRVPAYMICQDKTLEHLTRVRPTTLDELNHVYGLGESKIARFGAELLKALREAEGND